MHFAEPIVPMADALAQQYELEKDMRHGGMARYARVQERGQQMGRETDTDYGVVLMTRLHEPLKESLDALVVEKESGKAGPKGSLYKTLKEINDNDAVAFIILRAIVTRLVVGSKIAAVARLIGNMLEDEVRLRAVREADKFAFARITSGAQKRVSYANKRAYIQKEIARSVEDESWEEWPEKTRLTIGMQCIDMVLPLGLIEKITTGTAKDTEVVLSPTAETLDFIEKRGKAASILSPTYEPMIVEPMPWEGPIGGGYVSREVRPLKAIRSTYKETLEGLADIDLSAVYEALNLAQRTSWSINSFTLTTMQMLFEMNLPVAGVPRRYDEELPPKPHDIDENDEARTQWRHDAADVYAARIIMRTKRAAFMSAMGTATKYSLFPAIYFPYNLDFRGRMYAACSFNPQGPDLMKGLLHFAEGKPLTEDSSTWLAIHLANCADAKTEAGKTSKLPLADRVAWVYDNEERIIATAQDPFEDLWWTEMDQPVCFLAACNEWRGWVEQGEGFISHLAIALDGSCSGTQHFSMALRDEVGGAAVNLVPSEKPSDIYTLVLDKVIAHIQGDAIGEEDISGVARQWLASGLLVRSTVKRGVMTFSYGSKTFGFREQLMEDLMGPAYRDHRVALREGKASSWVFDGRGVKAAGYLAQVLFTAVSETVKKSAEAMEWLTKIAKVVANEGLRVRWHTPDGLPVVQGYLVTKPYRINTALNGSRIQLSLAIRQNEVDARRQASAVAPNFVHSLDATHLRLTVRAAASEGMRHFALIHDSFGVHAADTGRFFTILRETMVEMYRDGDVFEILKQELTDQVLPENRAKIPALPTPGSLDLERVVDCDFAFA